MRRWVAWWGMVLVLLCSAPAAASGTPAPVRSDCHAAAKLGETIAALVADGTRWRCGGEPSLQPGRAGLRFTQGDGPAARYFSARPSLFEALTLAVVRDGAVVAERHLSASAIPAGPLPDRFLIALPARPEAGDSVVAVFDAPTTRGLFGDARLLASDPAASGAAMRHLLFAAVVCGMLIMPLAFNAAYFRVLRERFVLWHLAMSIGLLIQCLLTSGIVGHFIDVPIPVYRSLVTLSFGLSVAAAVAFCAAFIEPRKLSPRLRRALYAAAAQVCVVAVVHVAFPRLFGPFQSALYYMSFLPVMVVFTLALVHAWRRGSRAVRYQLVGWSPFILMGAIRIVTMLTPAMVQTEAMALFYIAMVVESVATSLGVADRFMEIKHQRDRAVTRAQSLERLSERDDLTGLYNRRALDGRLGNFAAQRFTGFAVFDLDNFKRVNDTHGHAVGDAVLRTVAQVLEGHENATAVRLGGEEFLLLLKGDHVSERVERLREAIPVRIAREVSELQSLVTASAGLVEAAPGRDVGGDFIALYRSADDLLYEAKHHGRNLLAAVTLQRDPAAAATRIAAA